jgi:metal-sulfur cluster biosynthetic enzyme
VYEALADVIDPKLGTRWPSTPPWSPEMISEDAKLVPAVLAA